MLLIISSSKNCGYLIFPFWTTLKPGPAKIKSHEKDEVRNDHVWHFKLHPN